MDAKDSVGFVLPRQCDAAWALEADSESSPHAQSSRAWNQREGAVDVHTLE